MGQRTVAAAAAVLLLGACDIMLGPRAESPVLTTTPDTDLAGETWGPWAAGLVVYASITGSGEIHYTTDLTAPTIRSPVYPAEGLTINESTTIQAITVEHGYRYSFVTSGYYEIQ